MADRDKCSAQGCSAEEPNVSGRSSFGKKCSHLAKKQRAKFYILRRCVAMLVCWHEKNEPKDDD